MKKIKDKKILIVGLGSIGKKYYEISKKYFDKKNILLLSKHQNKGNLNELKKRSDIDFIVLSNPCTQRFFIFKALLGTSKNFILEKPTFDKVPSKIQLNEINKKILQKKIKIINGYCLRNHPCVTYLKNLLKKNKKKIFHINFRTTTYLPDWRTRDYRRTVSSKKILGGGVLNELSHEIDLATYLFGKPISVYSKFYKSHYYNTDTEDGADILFYLKSKKNINIHMNFVTKKEKREIEIIFDDGSFINLDLIKNKLSSDKINKMFKLKKNYLIEEQLKKLIFNFKEKKLNQNFLESVEVIKIINKVRLSNKQKKQIKI